ncbi:MAG: NAD(+) diphosphatase [Proteobacteria bacterium]|jgi:NAD+ diphosphatase|nr:NAD(+) diphosphatase [Pseudomonadota bacterium]
MAPENLFAGAYLDRRAEARLHEGWLAEAQADPATLYLAIRAGAALIHPAGTHPAEGEAPTRIAFLEGHDPRVCRCLVAERTVLLGWFRNQRCVLVEVDADTTAREPFERFAELRPLASELPPADAGLVAYARALNLWHAGHRFCGHCGAPTRSERAGHMRRCTACERQSFPRLDPAIIVLVHDGERALLGRQASWQPNRYSTIAGFVEPGESLEDAVRREVAEEAGVTAHAIAYHSSQPWPFPASLMLGFVARAEHTTPELRDGELEDARWFTRDEIRSGAVHLPPRESISRRLIEHWLHGAP